jgi:Ser/Thr protein kinase RdoA (MazF antagonist)
MQRTAVLAEKSIRSCWGHKPEKIHPVIKPYVDRLYELRKPIPDLSQQLIHGDLNPQNILVAPNHAPGSIDMTPFWAPVDFAVAMFAKWIGPRHGDRSALHYFENISHFKQLLVRAGIRMLLIMTYFEEWETSSEKEATEIILEILDQRE